MTVDARITSAFEADNGFALEPHLVVLALMGSHSHGTYLPPEEPNAVDDIDLMGFVVPPIEYHLASRAGSAGRCRSTARPTRTSSRSSSAAGGRSTR